MIILKVRQSSPYRWQVKNGRKLVATVVKVTGGYHSCCKVWGTLGDALEAVQRFHEQTINALGGSIKVEIKI